MQVSISVEKCSDLSAKLTMDERERILYYPITSVLYVFDKDVFSRIKAILKKDEEAQFAEKIE